jgi:2-polyprenyl-3-methyl-5-hydroxy-6-metoxy-1,4-benzoquinol methylase
MANTSMTENEIKAVLEEVVLAYPSEMQAAQKNDITRIAFNIHLALGNKLATSSAICDIGGGVGLFAPGCAALGMKALLIDDFSDPINESLGDAPFQVHRKFGVQVMSRDVIRDGVADIDEQFDIVTTFDSMEHWHHSPKKLFSQVRHSLLKSGGRFVLCVPNCVNLRKRLSIPFGVGKWSPMSEWYEQPVFRSHVREPDVDDLLYIARDMSLKNPQIVGRNWIAYDSRFDVVRRLAPVVDAPLRLFPRLCGDIYLTGTT